MYTFLTVLHVVVCIFLMLVVLLQAGRGGGIGLAFGGGGGSQSVFGSSGGATFLTKMTAVCAIVFFANSLALAYLSSQSDSRRLERLAEKNAQTKKAEEAANKNLLKDIEKQRQEQAKAEAQKSVAVPTSAPAEGTAGEEKAEDKEPASTDKTAVKLPSPAIHLTLPEQGGHKAAPGGAGKLAADLKLGRPEKLGAAGKPGKRERTAAGGKSPGADPVPRNKAAAEKATAEKKSDETPGEKPATE